MKHKRLYSKYIIFLLCLVLLTGCNKSMYNQNSVSANEITSSSEDSDDSSTSITNASAITLDSIKYEEDDYYQSWDKDSVNYIKGSGNNVEVEGSGVSVKDNIVSITSEGTYVISGEFDDNQIQVDAGDNKKVRLILNGATINSSDNAPIYVVNAEKVIISLEEGTTNILTDAKEYKLEDSSDEPNAAIFSKSDLTFNGTGTLAIDGNYNNGVTSKDDLKVTGGNFKINAVDDGFMGKDSIVIKEGNFTIVSGGDGMKASNDTDTTKGYIAIENGTFTITSELDAMQATTCITIGDGKYTIKSGGGSVSAVAKTGNDAFGMKGNRPDNMFPDSNAGTNTDNNTSSSATTDANNTDSNTSSNATTDANSTDSNTSTTEDTSTSKKAFKAPSNITILGGTFTIDSADDAIHSNNTISVADGNFAITAGDDGIHADSVLEIKNGTINIDKSYEGIESAAITISDGNIHITSSDDAVNVAGGNDGSSTDWNIDATASDSTDSTSDYKLTISGGKLWADAGGDGLDSNGSIYMNGGDVIVNGPTNDGNASLDYGGEFILNGGSLVVVGSSGMAQAPAESSKQYSIAYTYSESQTAGTLVHLEDSNGNNVVTFAPEKAYQWLLISTPELKKGSTYQLYSGGTSTGTVTDGLYADGSYKGGTQVMKYTLSKIVTWLTVNGEEVTASEGGMKQGGGFGRGGKGAGGMRPGDSDFNPGDNSIVNPDDTTSSDSSSTTNNNSNSTDTGNTY